MIDYVLYHRNCVDGFCSAWLFKCVKPNAITISVSHYEPLPTIQPDSNVYIVDFCYTKQQLEELSLKQKSVTVIDHHKSARKHLRNLQTPRNNISVYFDENHSGASLCLKYLNPEKFTDQQTEFVKYVEDYDLWRHKYQETKYVNSAIRSYPFNFDVWDNFNLSRLIEDGQPIYRYNELKIMEHIKRAKLYTPHDCLGVECTHVDIVSSLAGRLSHDRSFGFCWHFDTNKETYKFSLRSSGDFDVAEFCEQFDGGGGHRQAAGFNHKEFIFERV